MKVVVCDICKDPEKEAFPKSYFSERKMDAAGSMDDEHEYADLCSECELRVYKMAIAKLIHFQPNILAEVLRELRDGLKVWRGKR